ncbi:MAG: hypothetical protein KJ697_00775 [Nanoarchaeota archaeon]|nr:hypothetical protein [Nanoarchaeota archaeon]MBU4123992.1 hypothetical protein [Nanoarchaeota archaeon]
MNFLELSEKAIGKIKSTQSTIQVVVHNDADGLSSAAILIYALAYLNKRFQVTITKKINSNTTDALLSRNPELIIFTDIGSSYPEEIRKLKSDIIILDHHDVKEELPENVIHLNPELFGLTGLSGSGTVYMFTRDIIKDNRLAPLALVGTIGDSADSMFSIFDDISSIGRKTGLKLYGRFTRPLHKALEYSSEIPNISDESKAIQFLAENGIRVKEGDEWRTLGDLNEQEYQKLCDSLIREQLEHGHDISKLFGDVWTLKNFPQEIQDVKEFATLLNACVTGDTMIYVNGIPIAIKNISNKNIFSINENLKLEKDYIFRTHKIKLHNAIKLLRLKTNSGKSIDLTENHKLLTIKDGEVCWADVKNLRKGDIVACPKSIDITGANIKFDDFSDKLKNNYFKASKLSEPIKIPSNIDRDICSLIGYVIGDGHLDNYRVTICFNKTKEETENYKIISNIINKHFGIKNHYIENRAHSFVATWNRKSLADLLEMVGIQKGDKACTVNMHPKLLEINERNMCGLLSGLFSSDGSYYKDHLEFSSHSVSLAKQVQYLLLRVGINSSLSEPICKDCGRKKYRVLIYDTENFKIFLDKIGFMSSEKNKKIKINNRVDKKTSNTLPVNKLILKLSEIINVPPNKSSHFTYYKKGKMPTVRNLKIYLTYFKEKIETAKPILISRDIENFMKEMKISKRSFSEEIGLSREWLTKILNGKKPGKNANEKIKYGIEKYEKKIKEAELIIKQLEILCESNINWEKIKEINDIKNRPKYVYDITSTRNANYVANGLIVHNCGRMGEGGIGIGICLGSKRALEKSKSVIKEYRGLINKSLRWVENHPESVKNTNYATYIIAQSAINENLIGVIVSMCFNNDNGKPIFGLADADGETKISARAEGIDINDVISKAAKHVGGNSGGHLQAAGATIPTGTEDLFIQKCDELIKNAVLLN